MSLPTHPRLDYLRGFSCLSFWYAHRRIRQNLSTFEDAINARVDLFRMTRYHRGNLHPSRDCGIPEWEPLLSGLREIYHRHLDSADTAELEREALDLLWPHFDLPTGSVPTSLQLPPDRPYECWTFNYDADRIHLHIYNVYRPHSPLGDMRPEFAACLLRLLEDSLVRRPDVQTVACGSWLNAAATFLDLFPPSWAQSAVLSPEVQFTMGYWGQVTDRRGGFHHKNGAALRQTGEFPYLALRCHCAIPDAIAHLRAHFSPPPLQSAITNH